MFSVSIISETMATRIVQTMHYSNSMPRLNKIFLGCYDDKTLIGVITLGRGTRPLHTIKKLFPSLGTQDYLEIGRMCFSDEYLKNTESQFLSLMIKWVKKNLPKLKCIYTRADGMLGRPGYVYQAANYLYGGYIWTDTYFGKDGEKIHPRTTNKIGGRPNTTKQKKLGWNHYQGKQFRYIYFVCNKREKKRLLSESTIKRTINYPKEKDLEWKKQTDNGYVLCDRPIHNSNRNRFLLSNGNIIQSLF